MYRCDILVRSEVDAADAEIVATASETRHVGESLSVGMDCLREERRGREGGEGGRKEREGGGRRGREGGGIREERKGRREGELNMLQSLLMGQTFTGKL